MDPVGQLNEELVVVDLDPARLDGHQGVAHCQRLEVDSAAGADAQRVEARLGGSKVGANIVAKARRLPEGHFGETARLRVVETGDFADDLARKERCLLDPQRI